MAGLGMYPAGMQPHLFHAPSPGTLLRSSQTDALSFTPQHKQQQQPSSGAQDVVPSAIVTSNLSPHHRTQVLLGEMAGLTSRLVQLAGSKIWQGGHNKVSGLQFLPSATIPAQGMAAATPRELLALIETHQGLLSGTVSEMEEVQHLEEEKRRVAESVAEKGAAMRAFTKRLRGAEQVLESTLEEYECYRKPKRGGDGVGLGTVAVQELVSYAHRISYTTFAPPDFADGQNALRNALPPAPQDEQMRASQLYLFADMDVGIPKPTPAAAATPAVAEKDGNVDGLPAVPAGWKPGMPVELPSNLPPMPPGWKPGLPISLPEGLQIPRVPEGWKPGDAVVLPQVPQRAALPPLPPVLQEQAQAAAAAPPASQPGVIHVPFVQLDLNPELEDDYGSEYSEDFGSSEEED